MKRDGWRFYLTLAAMVAMICLVWAGRCHGADLTDAIGATCKVFDSKQVRGHVENGVGTGFLYETGPEQTGGEELAWIATAAHVVDGGSVTVQFGPAAPIRARVLWRNPWVDGGVLVVPYRALPAPRPRPIRLVPPTVRVRVGQQLWSIGYPNGREKMAWKGQAVGYEGGTLLFRPGPELGRSGSAVLAEFDGDLRVVGILSARDSENLTPWTQGRAVSTSVLLGATISPTSGEWFCQCPGGVCPSPGYEVDPYRLSPYRQKQDQINRGQSQRISGLEKSQGTMPLPQTQPQISDDGLLQRVVRLEMEADAARQERTELVRRADVVRDTARELAEKYEPQLKGISADVNQAIAASADAAKAASLAAGVAGDAKTQAAGAVEKAVAVEEETKGLKGKVEEILQGGGPLKQLIQSKLEDRGMSPTVAALFSGLGVGLIAVVLIVFLRKEGAKAAAGEPTVAQRLAALTPSELDDRVAAAVAKGQAALHERVAELRGHVAGLAGKVAGSTNPTQEQQ